MYYGNKICVLMSAIIGVSLHAMECERLLIDGQEQSLYVVHDMQYLRSILNATRESNLVLFNIDDAVIIPQDPYDREYVKERRHAHTLEALIRKTRRWYQGTDEQRKMLVSRAMLSKKAILTHDDWPAIINDLHKRNIPTVAITKGYTGSYGAIPSMEDWYAQELRGLGIEFDGPLARRTVVFDHLQQRYMVPVFKHGILFTGHACTRAELLMTFCHVVKQLSLAGPIEKVISIGVKKNNLLAEYCVLKDLGIACMMVQYVAGLSKPAVYDRGIAEFQLKYFIESGVWLTGARAQEMLESLEQDTCCCQIQ